MPGSTPRYGITKPLPGDRLAEGALTIGQGFEDVDALMVGKPSAAYQFFYVTPNGNDNNSGRAWADSVLTLQKALDLIGTNEGLIMMGVGVIDAGAGVSLSGKKCSLRGCGSATKITATQPQQGAVLDFNGYNPGTQFTTRRVHGDFAVFGDNVADPTNTHKGINFDTGIVGGLAGNTVMNVTVQNTGGSCFDFGQSELSLFVALVATTPVAANANDIPYMVARGAFNSNHLLACGLRSLTTGGVANVGVSGAVLITDNGSQRPYGNNLDSWWIENLQLPTGGSVFHIKGQANRLGNPMFSDSGKSSVSNTDTAFAWFDNPAVSNNGANVYEGHVYGNIDVDAGVRLTQSRNRIVGTKGYNGGCVRLDAGVGYTYVDLGGQRSGTNVDNAFIDNSGQTTNTLIDHAAGVYRVGTNIQEIGQLSATNSGMLFRNTAQTPILQIRADQPWTQFYDTPGNLSGAVPGGQQLRYRGSLAMKAAPVGDIDVLWWWRKKANEAYEWTPVTPPQASGQVTGTPPAGGTVTVNVSFPAGRFSAPPRVTISLAGVANPATTHCAVDNVTATGCSVYIARDTATATAVNWYAIGNLESGPA